jgi:uncharacterized coiled-coil DUF342 family protein
MSDFSVLKKLAQDANEKFPALEDQWSMVCTPTVGLDLIAEIDRLNAALSAPDDITAEPAADYDALRKQFLALRTLANSKSRQVSHWRNQCGTETREALLANSDNVNAERDTNQMLTAALLAAEEERDQLFGITEQLKAENEALRKALREVMTQVDGNIRETVRDCVNGHNDVQDIYGYCDAIEAIVGGALLSE